MNRIIQVARRCPPGANSWSFRVASNYSNKLHTVFSNMSSGTEQMCTVQLEYETCPVELNTRQGSIQG